MTTIIDSPLSALAVLGSKATSAQKSAALNYLTELYIYCRGRRAVLKPLEIMGLHELDENLWMIWHAMRMQDDDHRHFQRKRAAEFDALFIRQLASAQRRMRLPSITPRIRNASRVGLSVRRGRHRRQ